MEYKRLTERRGKLVIDKCQNCENVSNPQGCTDKQCYEIIKNRLAELEDKIEKGTLIELPCKVGDTVYVIYQYCDFLGTTGEPFIEEDIAKGFVYDKNKMKIVPSNYAERNDYWCRITDILLTREEAEKQLEELKK